MKSNASPPRTETLEDFYRHKLMWPPEAVRENLGHFNLFRLEPPHPGTRPTVPYRRREYYKVMLVKGNSKVHYADKSMQVQKQALSFSNPLIPYQWENLDRIQGGVYCIFNETFIKSVHNFKQYEVFQPAGNHIFELTDQQVIQVEGIFLEMEKEFRSDYKYKFDRIRNLILELVHLGLKMQPIPQTASAINASQRIAAMFLELLERQFPVNEAYPRVKLRHPADFARQLNIHVNHLNRALKESLNKTTSHIIAERMLQEARVMLRQPSWSIADIAYALGFSEAAHFNHFFKKNTGTSPSQYRKRLK